MAKSKTTDTKPPKTSRISSLVAKRDKLVTEKKPVMKKSGGKTESEVKPPSQKKSFCTRYFGYFV